jgi:bla regulator protein blaR1
MLADLLPHQAIAWLLTYLLHSTLLLGLAWLVSKPLSRWSAAAEEAVWKLALVGALFTASLQLAAGWEPVAGRWNLQDLAPPAQSAAAAGPVMPLRSAAPVVPSPRLAEAVPAEARRWRPSLPALMLGAWALGASLLLAGYCRSHLRLSRRLENRPRVVGGTLLSRLRSLSAEAGLGGAVRLSCSSRVPVPLALGLARSEICVPPRALAGLTDEQQEGMLAHELAHLVRRDPFWLVVGQVMACVFFFQPLNWVARRRLREISEVLSDEWAVTRTGRPLSLAGCLAEVAGWSTAGRELPVPGMAVRTSHLARRIRRLLDEGRSPESPARRLWLGAGMVVLLIAVVAAAPAISAARQEAPARPESAAVQEVSDAAAASEAAEPSDAEEPKEYEVVEERVAVRPDDADDSDPDYDYDLDFDYDYDFDFDFNADEIADLAAESVTAALDALDGHLEGMSELRSFSEEDQEKLEQEMERANREIERTLKPRMEQLSRELSEKLSHGLPTADMRRLEEEMSRLAEQMRPSEEELARLHALVDEEVRKLGTDGPLSREEREKLREETRRLARDLKPTEEQRKAMEELRRQHRELSQKFTAEHREEIVKANREMQEATRQMREEIRKQMDAVRQEVHRSMEQQRLRRQEEHRELQRQREELREQRERNRQEIRKQQEREREEGEAKPPKV